MKCKDWKAGAKRRNIPFNIDYEYVMDILEQQKFKCFYTNQEMTFGTQEEHNSSLSIDKVVPELGYIKGNVVFCTHKVNLGQNQYFLRRDERMDTKILSGNTRL